MQRILHDGIGVETAGDGPVALQFLHGGGGGKSDWRAQMQQLSASFRTISIDLPGHGESSLPSEPTIEHMAVVATTVRKRHGLMRNVLIGHSMGAWVALESYRRDPTGIAAIALIECSRLAQNPGDKAALQAQVRAVGGKNLLRHSYGSMFLPGTDPQIIAASMARVERLSDNFIESVILSTIEWDATHMDATLQSLRVPLLILQSTAVDGALQRRSLSRPEESPWIAYVAEQVPHAERQVITNAGHFPHIDQPATVNAALERFVRRLV